MGRRQTRMTPKLRAQLEWKEAGERALAEMRQAAETSFRRADEGSTESAALVAMARATIDAEFLHEDLCRIGRALTGGRPFDLRDDRDRRANNTLKVLITLAATLGNSKEANAKLIAAAPGLYEALARLTAACVEDFGRPDDGDEDDEPVGRGIDSEMAVKFGHIRDALAALARVEGQ